MAVKEVAKRKTKVAVDSPASPAKAKAPAKEKTAVKPKTPKTHVVEYALEKSTKSVHIYGLTEGYSGAVKTAKQYLRVEDYPKAPKTLVFNFTA